MRIMNTIFFILFRRNEKKITIDYNVQIIINDMKLTTIIFFFKRNIQELLSK